MRLAIDRAGYVSSATAAGFPDERVRRCVAHTYEIMSFPPPAAGVATVVSALVFVPT